MNRSSTSQPVSLAFPLSAHSTMNVVVGKPAHGGDRRSLLRSRFNFGTSAKSRKVAGKIVTHLLTGYFERDVLSDFGAWEDPFGHGGRKRRR